MTQNVNIAGQYEEAPLFSQMARQPGDYDEIDIPASDTLVYFRKSGGALAAWDEHVSYCVFQNYNQLVGWRRPLIILELSGHGALWLLMVVTPYITIPHLDANTCALLLNFFIGLLADLFVVGVCKPIFHRPRPRWADQKQFAVIDAVDQYSFPSGHTSRAIFIASFFIYASAKGMVSVAWAYVFFFWALLVAVSRVALGRHHVLDVVAGVMLGLLVLVFVLLVWVSPRSALAFRTRIRGVFGG